MKNMTLNTLEEMVAFALRQREPSQKYMLQDRDAQVWENEAAGQVWQEASLALDREYAGHTYSYARDVDPEKYEEYKIKDAKLRELMPAKLTVKIYWLEAAGTGSMWHSRHRIELSTELGEMLDGIWKTKERYPSGMGWVTRTGWLTIQGMLKRLGRTDIGKQVQAAQKAAQERQERQHKIQVARNLLEQLEQTKKAIERANELGVYATANTSINILTDAMNSFIADNEEAA